MILGIIEYTPYAPFFFVETTKILLCWTETNNFIIVFQPYIPFIMFNTTIYWNQLLFTKLYAWLCSKFFSDAFWHPLIPYSGR